MRGTVLILAVVGCLATEAPAWSKTATIAVTVRSDIGGATVYEGTEVLGVTPVKLKYRFDGACTFARPLRVLWPSGAEASIDRLEICAKTGKEQHFTFI